MGYFLGLSPAGKLSISTWEVLRYKFTLEIKETHEV